MMLALLTLALGQEPEAAWVAGEHAVAADGWADQIDAGARSGDLHYDLGNALYREGDLAGAMLAWRRAELLAPRDGDISANLEHARKQTADRIDPVDETSVLFWRTSLSPAEQGWAATLLLAVLGLLGVVWRLRPGTPVQIPVVLTGVPALLLTASTLASLAEFGSAGVVLADTEVTSTASGGVVLFELHPGAEVALSDRIEGRIQVELPDGRKGWMELDRVGLIDPRLPAPRLAR
ncbi:MAG: tetratricopeptide repeat protein [Proteobacteria bacterium]|nr:tetratricopeptide repeat protein [Pseudomonadota bacterium]